MRRIPIEPVVEGGLDDYIEFLDELGDDVILETERREAWQCLGGHEAESADMRFSSLNRRAQAEIVMALDKNLARTKRVNERVGNSYAIKHVVECHIGVYTSNLMAKTAMALLGFEHVAQLNPRYNIGLTSWRAFSDRSSGKHYRGRMTEDYA